jgi:hypothetical protein
VEPPEGHLAVRLCAHGEILELIEREARRAQFGDRERDHDRKRGELLHLAADSIAFYACCVSRCLRARDARRLHPSIPRDARRLHPLLSCG